MKRMCDKIRITVTCLDDWRTQYSKSIEVLIPDSTGAGGAAFPADFSNAWKNMKLEWERYLNATGTNDLMIELAVASATREATEIEAKKHEKDGEIWKVRAQLDEAVKNYARLQCQLDGLIKSINPSYVPTVERSEENL